MLRAWLQPSRWALPDVRPVLIRDVLQERPRADAEGSSEGFERRHVDPLQRDAFDKAGRGGLRQASERGKLVGVLDAAPFHVAGEVPADHGGNLALLLGLDKR